MSPTRLFCGSPDCGERQSSYRSPRHCETPPRSSCRPDGTKCAADRCGRQQRLRPLAGRAVARAVESVAPNAVLRPPLVGHRIGRRRLVHEAVRERLQHRHQRHARQLLAETPASPQCRADCAPAPGTMNSSIAARNASSITCGCVQRPGMHRLEPHRPDLGQALQRLARPGKFRPKHLRIAAGQSAHSPPGWPIRSTRPCARTVSAPQPRHPETAFPASQAAGT